ncbi:MAG: ribbon-helix-helix domain-containing protein [Pseudobdellovibrionaceae bacterium]|jgi:predicted DNA-binding ribbon-helix-helix protein|nr:ribbon-helix-helix domain-containing protein [Pseudobdellovibrionaceae bacterium]
MFQDKATENHDSRSQFMDEQDECRSTLVSRNITILGRRTSVRLEPEMWDALFDVSRREKASIHNICSLIYLRKVKESSLTAAIRVFLLLYFRAASTEDGHIRVRHGNFECMMARARVSDDMLRHRA